MKKYTGTCHKCGTNVTKWGVYSYKENKYQRYKCLKCNKILTCRPLLGRTKYFTEKNMVTVFELLLQNKGVRAIAKKIGVKRAETISHWLDKIGFGSDLLEHSKKFTPHQQDTLFQWLLKRNEGAVYNIIKQKSGDFNLGSKKYRIGMKGPLGKK